MKVDLLKNSETLIKFLNEQNYDDIIAKNKINLFCHDFNLKGQTFYTYKHSYFESTIRVLNLDSCFYEFLDARKDDFPTLNEWLEHALDCTMVNYCFAEDDGDYFDYEENRNMYVAISERLIVQNYIEQVQKLVTLIDIEKELLDLRGFEAFDTYIFKPLNLQTNSDILIFDYYYNEFIDFTIVLDGEYTFLAHNTLVLNSNNLYITQHDNFKLQHFKKELLLNKLNDNMSREAFNNIYADTIEEFTEFE